MTGPPPYNPSTSSVGQVRTETRGAGGEKDNDALRRENDRKHAELLEAHKENQRLKLELVEAQARAGINRLWIDHHLDRGSEVFSSSFAATVLSGGSPGIRLYVNQNNIMTELIYHGVIPDQFRTPEWDRGFVFPSALMPHSAITATNSEVSQDLISDGADHGRDIIRVFFFDPDGTLREWVHSDSTWSKTNLQIRGADPRNVCAICWTEGGFAEWSLFYLTTEGDRLFERRCHGGISGQWSRAVEVQWSRNAQRLGEKGTAPTQLVNSLHSAFTATTNRNGTDRRILYLDSSDGTQPSHFRTLKWGHQKRNKWSIFEYPEANGFPSHSWEGPMPSYSAFCMEGSLGIRIYLQNEDEIHEWLSCEEWSHGLWIGYGLGSDTSSHGAMVTAACQHSGDRFRQYVFSVAEERIVQTTYAYNNGNGGWHSKPIIIRNL